MTDNSLFLILIAFLLFWLSEGLALIFSKVSVELENKLLWHRILKKLEKELN